jgi:hypothetical protein
MTEEMKRQVLADYLLLAECRKWGWEYWEYEQK